MTLEIAAGLIIGIVVVAFLLTTTEGRAVLALTIFLTFVGTSVLATTQHALPSFLDGPYLGGSYWAEGIIFLAIGATIFYVALGTSPWQIRIERSLTLNAALGVVFLIVQLVERLETVGAMLTR